MIRRAFFMMLMLAGLTAPMAANAQSDAELRSLLHTPGVHAIMRHALAPGYSDPANFDVNDCNTQRNLSAEGRDQAKRVGAKLRELGAQLSEVRTSAWCRCEETAQLLGLHMPVVDPMLNSFFEDRSTAKAQTDALRAHLASLPDNKRVLYVTHQVNITALTGRGVGSGELFLIRLRDDGEVEVVGTLEVLP